MSSVIFLSFAAFTGVGDALTSSLASARYRVLLPARELARSGHQVSVASTPVGKAYVNPPELLSADTVVFSKSVNVQNEAIAEFLVSRGKRVVLDLCDDYFNHAALGNGLKEHTKRMCRIANHVVTSTDLLAQSVHGEVGLSPTVISDPVEGPRGVPTFQPSGKRLRLLWFGHPSNFESLLESVPELVSLSKVFELSLVVVTSPINEIAEAMLKIGKITDSLKSNLVAWSPQAVWSQLSQCDLVVIPALRTRFHYSKSPNRLLESVWAGRCVVAHPIPAYLPMRDCAFIGANLSELINAAVMAPNAVAARILVGQQRIASLHSPSSIGQQWQSVIFPRDF